MNREGIHTQISIVLAAKREVDPHDVANSIIDEFESHTCENCEYSNFAKSKQFGFCSHKDIRTFDTHLGIWFPLSMMKDFGCNLFEREKDD